MVVVGNVMAPEMESNVSKTFQFKMVFVTFHFTNEMNENEWGKKNHIG